MHVLVLASVYPPEVRSSATLMYELSESLCRMGHRVTVVAGATKQSRPGAETATSGEGEGKPGVRVLRGRAIPVHLAKLPAPLRGLGQIVNSLIFLRQALSVKDVDAIIAYSPPLASGVTAWLLGKRRSAPFILNVQDLVPRYAQELGILRNPFVISSLKKLEHFVYARAKFITVHSDGNKDYMLGEGVSAEKVVVVPNWADINEFDPLDRGAEFRMANGLHDRFVVLYAGMLGFAQDTDVILRCAARVKDNKSIVVLIVGDGVEKPRLMREAQASGLDNVRFLPCVPKDRYPRVVTAADVCLASLRKELRCPVVPSKLVGYMAAGRAIVAALRADGDAAAVVARARCGIRVDPGDAAGLAEAIVQLFHDRTRREEYGRNGREFARRHHDRERCLAIYGELLATLA